MESGLPRRLDVSRHSRGKLYGEYNTLELSFRSLLERDRSYLRKLEPSIFESPRYLLQFHVYADVLKKTTLLFRVIRKKTSVRGSLRYSVRHNPFVFPDFMARMAHDCPVETMQKYVEEFFALKCGTYGYRRFDPVSTRKKVIIAYLDFLGRKASAETLRRTTIDLCQRFTKSFLAPKMFGNVIFMLDDDLVCLVLDALDVGTLSEGELKKYFGQFIYSDRASAARKFIKETMIPTGECVCGLSRAFIIGRGSSAGFLDIVRSCKAKSHKVD